MAKDKERSINPAQAQRKVEKAKALKKSKAELQARRNEKLAQRNPARIQKQIDDLKALEAAGDIKAREKAILADLERDLKAVTRAREALGTKPSRHGAVSNSSGPATQNSNQGVLGKRRFDGARKYAGQDSGSDTDESIRKIPWPRDTPPPIPHEFRRHRAQDGNANTVPLGEGRSYPLPSQPTQAQKTYSSAPQIRDLKKEAVARFVPAAVQRKQEALRGTGGQLLEPEEYDRLEAAGYTKQTKDVTRKNDDTLVDTSEELRRLEAEQEAFEKELAAQDRQNTSQTADDTSRDNQNQHVNSKRQVEVEEIEDVDL